MTIPNKHVLDAENKIKIFCKTIVTINQNKLHNLLPVP
jgi:hypothetical protein